MHHRRLFRKGHSVQCLLYWCIRSLEIHCNLKKQYGSIWCKTLFGLATQEDLNRCNVCVQAHNYYCVSISNNCMKNLLRSIQTNTSSVKNKYNALFTWISVVMCTNLRRFQKQRDFHHVGCEIRIVNIGYRLRFHHTFFFHQLGYFLFKNDWENCMSGCLFT
jgi:hypothetical protein